LAAQNSAVEGKWEVVILAEFFRTFEDNMAPYNAGRLGSPPPLPKTSEKLNRLEADGEALRELGSEVLRLKKGQIDLEALPQGPQKYIHKISFEPWATYIVFQRIPPKTWVLPVVHEKHLSAAELTAIMEMATELH
jgi:hypothetical protein